MLNVNKQCDECGANISYEESIINRDICNRCLNDIGTELDGLIKNH